MDESKASDVEILLDGEEIAGVMVRPWTVTKCSAVTPAIEKIALELRRRKLAYRDFFAVTGDKVEVLNIEQLFFVIMPNAPEILKITLDMNDEQINKIKQEDIAKFIIVIIRQNIDYVKNLFALITMAMQMLKKATEA
jgi:hypothetical protein